MVMENLKLRAQTIFPNPPSIWVRYVDDVYAIMETEHIEFFHRYLNTINSSIQFRKEIEALGSLAFLDVFLHREANGSFPLMFTGSPHIPVDIYLIHLTILPLKSSALPEPSTQEPIIPSTSQNINRPSSITSTKHYKTMDFLYICALAINFLLSRLNLTLDLNSLTHTLLLFQFHMKHVLVKVDKSHFAVSRRWLFEVLNFHLALLSSAT